MALLQIDDLSPVIQYDASWHMGVRGDDDRFDRYSNGGTFHATQIQDARATIHFNGTGIAVHGSRRENHDAFSVRLDDRVTVLNGSGDDIFGGPIFSQELEEGEHTLEIWNSANRPDRRWAWLDIDYVIIKSIVPAFSYEMNHAQFEYLPTNAWSTGDTLATEVGANSARVARSSSVQATINFIGSAIDLYGVACQACGAFSISLDGVSQTSADQPFNASTGNGQWVKPNTLLFFARNLAEGRHALVLETVGLEAVALQNAMVYSTSSPPPEYVTSSSGPHPTASSGLTPSSSSASMTAAIVGASLGGAIFIVLLVALFLYIRQLRRRLHATRSAQMNEPVWHPQAALVGELATTGSTQPYMLNPSLPPSNLENAWDSKLQHLMGTSMVDARKPQTGSAIRPLHLTPFSPTAPPSYR